MADRAELHQPLTGHDRFFLDQETDETPMNVAALAVVECDRPASLARDVHDLLAGRIHRMPRLRQRLADVPLSGAPSVWVDDPCFDLRAQISVRHEVARPSREELVDLAGRLAAVPLDRDRPLWDVSVVPEVADGTSAVIVRMHHALVDGMSSLELGKLLYSSVRASTIEVPTPWEPEATPATEELVAEALAVRAADQTASATERALASSDPERQLAAYEAFLEGLISFSQLGPTPPNPFPPVAPGARRYTTTELADDQVRQIGRRFSATVEVVVLSIIALAVSRLLEARGESFDTVRLLLPLTRRNRMRTSTLGNHGTFNIIDLPVGRMSDAERVARVEAAVTSARRGNQTTTASALIDLADRVPAAMNQASARWLNDQSFVHAVVSYMRGPRRPLYLAGRAHLGTYPILPRSNGVGLLIGVVQLGGVATVGLVADPMSVPDLGFLTQAVRQSAAALVGST